MSAIYLKTVFISILLSLSSGAEDDSEDINEDYDKGYSELNNEIDGQVLKVIDKTKSLKKYYLESLKLSTLISFNTSF